MIHTTAEQRVDGKHVGFMSEPMREQNAYHRTHILPTIRLEPMQYFYPKLRDATSYNYSKQEVMCASNYNEAAYRNVKIIIQLTHCCVFIWHLYNAYDNNALINNLIF